MMLLDQGMNLWCLPLSFVCFLLDDDGYVVEEKMMGMLL
jgi:hypothetical protein